VLGSIFFLVVFLHGLSRVRRLGTPLGGRTGCRFLKHTVDLLEGETLGFRDEEVGIDEGACAKGTLVKIGMSSEVGILSPNKAP
jgi:hypothetical protein